MATDLIKKIINCGRKTLGLKPVWQQIEYFNPDWKGRIQKMAAHIKKGESVVDLGCGQMWLKEFLPGSNKYTGVDYKHRGEGTVVADFNKGDFPEAKADVFFVSGCMEYVNDHHAFIGNIARSGRRCVISYCCVEDYPEIEKRRERAWVNDLTRAQVIACFEKNRMFLTVEDKTESNNSIFVFEKTDKEK